MNFFSITFKTLRHRVTGGFKSHQAQSVNNTSSTALIVKSTTLNGRKIVKDDLERSGRSHCLF
jgi:hypothetical protein